MHSSSSGLCSRQVLTAPQETGRIVALLFEKDPSIVNLFHDDAAGWTSVGEAQHWMKMCLQPRRT